MFAKIEEKIRVDKNYNISLITSKFALIDTFFCFILLLKTHNWLLQFEVLINNKTYLI